MIFFTITGVIVWGLVAFLSLGWGLCHLIAKAELRRVARLTASKSHLPAG